MSKTAMTIILALILSVPHVFAYQSLQELFDLAGPYGGYDKFIELDPAEEYIGDLWIDSAVSVRLIGNGALVHGGISAITIMYGRLNISGCVIVGGYEGLFFSTNSSGEIHNNTITNCQNYGISVIYPNDNDGVYISDNIITDCFYGIFCIEDHHPAYIGFNTIWNTQSFRYAEQCLDWGGTIQPFDPGQGDQDLDPMFVNPGYDDFSLQGDSPCIGSGRNGDDRGAIPYQTGVNDAPNRPLIFDLKGNYPNPFNASTTLGYSLAEPADVTLEIFDLLGRKIESYSMSNLPAGDHNITWQAGKAPSGVYFYRLNAGGLTQTRRMMLLK